jgi:hypothetical protein
MSLPHGEALTLPDARLKAARVIRNFRKRIGGETILVHRGKEWELCEPEDCFMVPDQCGVLCLEEIDDVSDAC